MRGFCCWYCWWPKSRFTGWGCFFYTIIYKVLYVHLRWCRISCLNRIIGGCMYKIVSWTFFVDFFSDGVNGCTVYIWNSKWSDKKNIKWFPMITESDQYHFQEFWGPLFQKHRNAVSATLWNTNWWGHSCIWEYHDSSPPGQPWNTWKCHIKPVFRDVVWHRDRSAKYLIPGTGRRAC